MIGNAHLDPAWQWSWQEGCAEAIGTCWAAIDRLEEGEKFIFTRGEAVIYQWIEQFEPQLFARIQHFVREGRWVIVNGWWLQPDCNLPDGEAFLRQALYGKQYFREKYGVDVTVGYNVDSFGHAATLPMLLQHTGFESYVFSRPGPHEKVLPGSLFDWIAPDGSRVLTARVLYEYHTRTESLAERIPAFLDLAQEEGHPLMCFYGVGNHGGGPTRTHIAAIEAAQEQHLEVEFSDPVRYFAAVAEQHRPQVHDELQMHAIGCYSATSALKKLNRRAEARLAQTEAASTLAWWRAGAAYPHAQLRTLWQKLLFNQFHDILGGVCTPSVTQTAVEELGGVLQGAEELLNAALRRLAATIAPGPDTRDSTFVLFNLTGNEQQVPVEYEPWLDWHPEPRRLLDHTGTAIAYQEVRPEGLVTGLGLRRILFVPRIPAFGYQLYRFALCEPDTHTTSSLHITPTLLENSTWQLALDPMTGGIAHLTNKLSKRELFADVGHLPIVVEDPSDNWSHGREYFDREGTTPLCERVEIVEQGPLRASIRVSTRVANSTIISTYQLYDDPALPLEIHVHIDWHERQRLLRFRYPFSFARPTFRYEIPAGWIERPANGKEWPGLRWVLISDEDNYGLALTNDAKYSYAAQDGMLFITALRSPIAGHHDPYVFESENAYSCTDQGEQTFTLRLLAGPSIDTISAQQLADELLRPPIATPHVSRNGTGEYSASFLSIQAESSHVTWLKVAEDESGLIARVQELAGKQDRVVLSPEGDTTLQPFGMATLHLEPSVGWSPRNGLEEAE